jgi:hypothetical protein
MPTLCKVGINTRRDIMSYIIYLFVCYNLDYSPASVHNVTIHHTLSGLIIEWILLQEDH